MTLFNSFKNWFEISLLGAAIKLYSIINIFLDIGLITNSQKHLTFIK